MDDIFKEAPIDLNKAMEDANNLRKTKREVEIAQETKRINCMKCPCCMSRKKGLHREVESNGVFGPGSSMHVTNEYYICLACGVHYTDLNKPK